MSLAPGFIRMFPPILCAVLFTATASFGAVLYDLDFDTPPHEPGQPPAVGDGPPPRQTVTSLVGEPLVLVAFGGLTQQPCRLDALDHQMDQIRLALDDLPRSTFYAMTCRLEIGVIQTGGSFTVHFDAPDVHSISFNAVGDVRIQLPGVPSQVIGTYPLNAVMELSVNIDLEADTWRIYLDGAALHAGDFGGATEVTTVRFTTSADHVSAAVDDVVIASEPIPGPPGCERLEFEDLVAGTFYFEGDRFSAGSALVQVMPIHTNTGPCEPPTVSNFARVTSDHQACGPGQELSLVNTNLAFEFDGAVTDVMIPFGQTGALINLAVNGDCRSLPDFSLLDGQSLGGVDVSVSYQGLAGDGCGIIVLSGEVQELMVGGQGLAVDDVSFCRPCPAPALADFEDLSPGASYGVGDGFASGFASFTVTPFYQSLGCNDPSSDGTAAVWNTGTACASGQEMYLQGVNVAITSSLAPYETITLDYGEFAGLVNLEINGHCLALAHFANANGMEVGGAMVFASDHGDPSGGCGRLHVTGAVEQFAVGGEELWIDDLRACTTGGDVVAVPPSGRAGAPSLAQNFPNPFNPQTSIRFSLTRPGPVRLAVYDLAGRRVAVLADADFPAGAHEVSWDGRGDRGQALASGVYLYRLEAAGRVESRRMVMLR